MADNISVLDSIEATQTVKTTETAGVHTPHQNVDKLTPGTAAANLGKAQDAAAAAGDTGVAFFARRSAAAADIAGLEGDYEFLQMKDGRLYVRATLDDIIGAAKLGKAHDAAAAASDTGVAILARRSAAAADIAGADGDYEFLQVKDGRLYVRSNVEDVIPGTGATKLGKAHDAAAAASDTGVAVLARRSAAAADIAGADGDYEFLQVKDGRLYVRSNVEDVIPGTGATKLGKAQDAAAAGSDTGVAMFARRTATPADIAGTEGDYEFLQVKDGRLYTRVVEDLTTPVAQTVASSGAASNVGFAAAALRSGVLVCSAPSANVSKVFIHLASESGAIGIELVPGAQVTLPPASNANAWEAHFVGAADNLYVTGS